MGRGSSSSEALQQEKLACIDSIDPHCRPKLGTGTICRPQKFMLQQIATSYVTSHQTRWQTIRIPDELPCAELGGASSDANARPMHAICNGVNGESFRMVLTSGVRHALCTCGPVVFAMAAPDGTLFGNSNANTAKPNFPAY